MQPVDQPITVYQGDRFDFFFRIRQKVWNEGTGEYEPGAYIDLTPYTIRSQVRNSVDDNTVRATFTCTKSNQVTTPGGCTITLSTTDTASLVENGVYDVEIETTANPVDRQTILKGTMTLTKQVTRT